MPIYATEHKIDNEVILIQIEMDEAPPPNPYGNVRGAEDLTKKVVQTARDVFGDGMKLAHDCAVSVVHTIRQMPDNVRPNEFEVQFAVKLNSEVGAVIAKMSTEAQLQISMKWTHKEST